MEGKLSRSSLEAYAGIGITIVVAVHPMNFLLSLVLVGLLTVLMVDALWRSSAMAHLRARDKVAVGAAVGALIALLFWSTLSGQFAKEHSPPPASPQTPASAAPAAASVDRAPSPTTSVGTHKLRATGPTPDKRQGPSHRRTGRAAVRSPPGDVNQVAAPPPGYCSNYGDNHGNMTICPSGPSN